MFQFPRFASYTYVFSVGRLLAQPGFPIRASPDYRFLVNYPKLIADLHALHRLLLPRHSPYALSFLSYSPKGSALCMLVSSNASRLALSCFTRLYHVHYIAIVLSLLLSFMSS